MTNFSSILEAAKTLAVIVSLLNGVATLLDTISVSSKKVRDFALRRLEKEIFLLILIQFNYHYC